MKMKGGKAPGVELNGLHAISAQMAKYPKRKILVLAVVDADQVIEYPAEEVRVEVLRMEAVGADRVAELAQYLEDLTGERTGKTRLDLEIPDDLDLREQTTETKPASSSSRRRKKPDIFVDEQQAIESGKPEDVIDAEIVPDEPTSPDTPPEAPTGTDTPGDPSEAASEARTAPDATSEAADATPDAPDATPEPEQAADDAEADAALAADDAAFDAETRAAVEAAQSQPAPDPAAAQQGPVERYIEQKHAETQALAKAPLEPIEPTPDDDAAPDA